LFAGIIADWIGRKPLMVICGLTFVVSIPVIALSQGYGPLFFGRLLQGISGGFIGIVVPLYLAECLGASTRGKGTGSSNGCSRWASFRRADRHLLQLSRPGSRRNRRRSTLFAFKDQAWRRIFWVSLPPGILFVIGSLLVTESPRWLFRRGKKDQAYAALLRSRTPEQAKLELREMEETAQTAVAKNSAGTKVKDSLLSRKYVIPFILPASSSPATPPPASTPSSAVQHRHSAAKRPQRPAGALGLRHLHLRQLPHDHGRHAAGRRKGRRFLLITRHQRHHSLHDRCRHPLSAHRKASVDVQA
jgi:hypothetical protein